MATGLREWKWFQGKSIIKRLLENSKKSRSIALESREPLCFCGMESRRKLKGRQTLNGKESFSKTENFRTRIYSPTVYQMSRLMSLQLSKLRPSKPPNARASHFSTLVCSLEES